MFLQPNIQGMTKDVADPDQPSYGFSTTSSATFRSVEDEAKCRVNTHSEMIVNRTGAHIYTKGLNGLVIDIPPTNSRSNNTIEIHTFVPYESVITEFGDLPNVNNINAIEPYILGFEARQGLGTKINDGERNKNPGTGNLDSTGRMCVTIIITLDMLKKYPNGYLIEGSDTMIFLDRKEAFRTTHQLTHSTEADWLKTTGIEITAYAPRHTYSSLFTNLGGIAMEVPIITSESTLAGKINLIKRDRLGKEIEVQTFDIDELLKSESSTGIRLYTNFTDAKADIRRSLTSEQLEKLNRTIEGLSTDKSLLEDDISNMKRDKLSLERRLRKEIDELKAKHEEELKALKKEFSEKRDRYIEATKKLSEDYNKSKEKFKRKTEDFKEAYREQQEKQKHEDTKRKTKERTGIFARIAEVIASVVISSGKIIAAVF